MIGLTFKWEGLTDLIASVSAQVAKLRDLRPAWRSVLLYLRRATTAQFDSKGGRSGDDWAPLSPAYAARKARIYPGMPILRASDRMFRSLVDQSSDSIAELEPREMTYGTRAPYARYHQKGTPKMPRRRILAITPEDRRYVQQAVRAHLGTQARISGFEV